MTKYVGWMDVNRGWGSPLAVIVKEDVFLSVYDDGTMIKTPVNPSKLSNMTKVFVELVPSFGVTEVRITNRRS
ncbi:MAG: hypothetical protein WC307_06120 [Candidatus Nanoarchaeia archaeon]|jgi:hypothetical protein